MADTKISNLTELAASPATTDEFVVVDKSDTTMAASGTNKRITPANAFDKWFSDEQMARMVALINSGLLFSAETRDSNGVVTSATIAWSRVVPGAANGVFSGTPHGTFTHMIELYTATFPDQTADGNTTMTVDFNLDANGQTSNPTIAFS